MITTSALINYDEDAKCYLSGDYKINDKIYVHFPTVREVLFDIGEKDYWTTVFAFVSTSSDLIAELDDKGLDWEEVSDFDLFIMNFLLMSENMIHIFLPTLCIKNFKLIENPDNHEINLYDPIEKITIDRNIFQYISDYIRFVHGLKKNVIKAGNAYTHQDLIDDAHDRKRWAELKPKEQKSQMKAYLSYLVASLGYTVDDVMDMRINFFFDLIKRVSAIETAKEIPFMAYTGMVDLKKKEVKKSLDPMRSF